MMMQRLVILLALVLTLSQPVATDVHLTATWERPNVARIAWYQPSDVTLTCLYRLPVGAGGILVTCWNDLTTARRYTLLGASANTDAAYRPVVGDRYTLTFDGGTAATAELQSVLRMPVFLH